MEVETVILCPVCGSEDEHKALADSWLKCETCGCTWDEDCRDEDALPWRCYHCGEVCRTHEQAHAHFGATQDSEPACKIDAAAFRAMEETVRRYREEDSELHREIHRLNAAYAVKLRQEEEAGYARGLADGRAYNVEVTGCPKGSPSEP